jgi:hypothetical protein
MRRTRIMKTLLLLTIAIIGVNVLGQQTDGVTVIEARVVAYDLGVEQASGLCRQTLIARNEKSARRSEADRYFIIRRDSFCPELMPEKTLQSDRKRTFNLKRDTKCDQDLQELKYFISMSPAGIQSKDPRLKPVRKWNQIKISTTKKMPCYIMITS